MAALVRCEAASFRFAVHYQWHTERGVDLGLLLTMHDGGMSVTARSEVQLYGSLRPLPVQVCGKVAVTNRALIATKTNQ